MTASVLALVNPGSGSSDVDHTATTLREHCPGVEILHPPPKGDLVAFVRAAIAERRPDLVVASGGDGTVSAVATAAAASGCPIAIVPTGTANVFAREIGVPLDVVGACELIAGGHTRRFDAMEYEARQCLCRIGVGVFGEIGRQTSGERKRRLGGLAYAFSAVPVLARPPSTRFVLDVDGRRVVLEGSCVVVTNVASVGWGELRWGERVRPDDGVVDVLVAHGETLPENLSVLWNAMTEGAVAAEHVSHLAARDHVRIQCDDDMPVAADGETLLGRDHVLRVRPGAVEVVVGATAPASARA